MDETLQYSDDPSQFPFLYLLHQGLEFFARQPTRRKERVRAGPSPSKNSDPRVKKFLSWWPSKYQETFGSPYHVQWGKDGKRVKDLLQDFDLPALQNRALQFLNSKDPWVRNNGGFTIGVFYSQINKLVSTAMANPSRSEPKELPPCRLVRPPDH